MKKTLRLLFVAAISFAILGQAHAQKNTAFAITGEMKGSLNWTNVREIDLSSGALIRNIYIPSQQKPLHVDDATGKEISLAAATNKTAANSCNCTAAALTAASAYDARQNRLYFVSLFGNEPQYIDLNQRQLKIYHVQNQKVKQFTARPGEADNITRMVIGSDGYGYALTNNGDHLIRFSTGKNILITDLGGLKDGANNNDISVHTQAASWGGDMIADDGGNLYLFTTGAQVFKINPATRVADYLGVIKGLPAPYSVNAAAVDKDGFVVVSSSLDDHNYFRVGMLDLKANAINSGDEKVFNASDFANGNFLASRTNKPAAPDLQVKANESKTAIAVYPNPVMNKTVQVYFNNVLQGNSRIEVTEMGGKKIAAAAVMINLKNQVQTVHLPAATTAGMYVVRVTNADKSVYSETVVVE